MRDAYNPQDQTKKKKKKKLFLVPTLGYKSICPSLSLFFLLFFIICALFLRYVIYNMWAIQSCRALYTIHVHSSESNEVFFVGLYVLFRIFSPIPYRM